MDQDFENEREDDVVISGFSGRFPKCKNMREYEEKLFLKTDLFTENDKLRWKLEQSETAQLLGVIHDVEKFDNDFFNVSFREAETMDPMGRMLLEHAFEAIVDAGVNPYRLRNKRIAVITASSLSETGSLSHDDIPQARGLFMLGGSKSMLSERISSWLNLTGPAFNVDTACSSSFYALEYGYRCIKTGNCDAAIVAGANLCLHPYLTLQFSRLGILSPDGKCKTFDESANGYTRSETISVAFLQRAKDAKRVYATVVHAKTNCDGFKQQGITYPSSELQSVLLREFYEECGIPTTRLSYVEAHGTGTKIGDPEEANAIDKVLCPGRKTPLKIGSIKSNLGHSEPASGMCAIGKIIIAMESGLIPPNMHFKEPRKDIEGLIKGRMKVVTEPTPWECDYAAASSFGFGGANGHILFKANPKRKVNNGLPKDDLPRLVCVSGRTPEAVDVLLDDLEGRPVDVEHVALLHNVYADNISGHPYRGYTILGPEGAVDPPVRDVRNYVREKKQVWFIFSGIGSQWAGMGTDLLRFSVFAKTLDKCDAVLKPLGVNLRHILTTKDKTVFDNLVNTFVGIAAMQIGLVDLLSLTGIVPDKTIGYSIGELGRAYADNCLTAEQVVLAAYHSALAINESKIIRGSMATVNLGYEYLRDLCPPDIEIACRNGPKSCVVSGPAEAVKIFAADLRANNISVQEISCSRVPLHSRYMAVAGSKLLANLKKTMNSQKSRNSVSKRAAASAGNLSSAEYHANNLLAPVLLEESISSVPKNAIIVEISPRGVLKSILEESVPKSVLAPSISENGARDNVQVLLGSLGSLFTRGLQPQVHKLYPEVRYPVSRSTPMIAPVIKWEHSRDWYVFSRNASFEPGPAETTIEITLRDDGYNFMKGHIVDKRNLLPATGYLDLVWDTLGKMVSRIYTDLSVVFENVKFVRATNLLKDNVINFNVSVMRGSGIFEVSEGDTPVCTGKVRLISDSTNERIYSMEDDADNDEPEVMKAKDVYKELKLRGYDYSGMFRSIDSVSVSGTQGHICWKENYVSFLDNMLQMKLLGLDSRDLFVPTEIQKIVIDVKKHHASLRRLPFNEKRLPVRVDNNLDTIATEGIEIRGLRANTIMRKRPTGDPVLEEYKFVPHYGPTEISRAQAIQVAVHVVLENSLQVKVKTVELVTKADKDLLNPQTLASPLISEILGNLPLIQKNISIVAPQDSYQKDSLPQDVLLALPKSLQVENYNALLAVGYDLLAPGGDPSTLQSLLKAIQSNGFILSRERTDLVSTSGVEKTVNVVLDVKVGEERLVLLRKRTKIPEKTVIVEVKNEDFTWISKLQEILEEEKQSPGSFRIFLVSEGDLESGLLGFASCLRRENSKVLLRVVLIQDPRAPRFSVEDPLFARQLELDLVFNVLRPGGVWGSYRHLPLPALPAQPVHHALVQQPVRGDLHSLTWTEGPIAEGTGDPRLVYIYNASLNFRDVMVASGRLGTHVMGCTRKNQNSSIGFEFSGIDSSGRRVMGMLSHSGLSNCCISDPEFTWEVPDQWSLEDAATIITVYTTCYMALYVQGKMTKGDKILIHAGSGGIGQAAINLALHEGCEIFTTVGTEEKRVFLKRHFPQIPEDHIGNSRDTSFEKMISQQTGGKGVDIVLNSLAEEKLQASIRCLAPGGRFLEIGKFDIVTNNRLDLNVFQKGISFTSIMLDSFFNADQESKREVHVQMERFLKKGAIKPIVRKVFPKEQVEEAFRFMAAGKHIGKVVIKLREEHDPPIKSIMAEPQYHCLPDRSYIIFGGLGGFGLELADWLVLRGAQNLVLISRNGITNGYQQQRVSLWQSYGVRLRILAIGEAWKRERCEEILREAADMAPVDGIFNLAVVLSDNLFENQTPETFEDSFRGKAWITKQLDALSRDLCPRLRHFVVFSSISSGRGNVGQTNYGMANSVMERICEKRVAEGLHGLAIQWGAVGDVGLVADMQEHNKELVIGGTLQQRITSCLQVMDGFLRQSSSPVVASMVVAEQRGRGSGADNIIDTVLNIMGIRDIKSVNPQVSLTELGMDSMSAVEIKQTLEREFEVFLTPQEIRTLNFAKVIELNNQTNNQEQEGGFKNPTDKESFLNLKNLIHITDGDYTSTAACLKLPTQGDTSEGGGEILFVPGIEGYARVLNPVLPKIRNPAICLQLGSEHEGLESIESMVEKSWPAVSGKWKKQDGFVLVGYSFGALLAIELARKLETEGASGRLVLIDGCPEKFKTFIEQQFPSFSIPIVESVVLMTLMDMLPSENEKGFLMSLEQCTTWSEKLQMFVQHLPSTHNFRVNAGTENSITAIYKRILALNQYCKESKAPLKSPIVFVKPTLESIHCLVENYGLDKVTEGKFSIRTVEGDHLTILESDQVAAIINGDPLEDEISK